MKRLIASIFACAAFVAAALPAAADGPTKAPVNNTAAVLPAGSFCPFEIDLSFPVDKETIKTFNDANGNPVRALVNGRLVATFTAVFANGSTKAVTLNISGPGEIVYNPDGSQTITFEGNSALFILQNGQPTFVKISGRVVTLVPAGSLTGLGIVATAAGRMANVCGLFG